MNEQGMTVPKNMIRFFFRASAQRYTASSTIHSIHLCLARAFFSLCYYFHYPIYGWMDVCIARWRAYLHHTIPLIRTNARNAGCCCFLFKHQNPNMKRMTKCVCVSVCMCNLNYNRLKFTLDCKVMSNNDKDA